MGLGAKNEKNICPFTPTKEYERMHLSVNAPKTPRIGHRAEGIGIDF
jgi:hypothetical protein